MDRIYIMAIATDLNGKPCRQLGTDGIFWVDNSLSKDNQIVQGIEQIKKYQTWCDRLYFKHYQKCTLLCRSLLQS